MPRYDYKCSACAEVFEVSRDPQDASDVTCAACGASARRRFTPVGVVFKGSGFHATDYRRGSDSSSESAAAPCGADKPASSACDSCPAKND